MYIPSALFTDLYQFTMAYGYWKADMAEQIATFHLFYRKPPFQGNYTIACGLANAIKFLESFSYTEAELDYLASLRSSKNTPFFSQDFINYLQNLQFKCDVDAVSEGTLVFPHEPLIRVTGPILQCQLIETALINFINYSSLIATKASRIYFAAKKDPIIEFGLRRAHGPDGGMSASRAAFIGGCESTSNTLAGKTYGIPVKGTVAHSWVMAFADELDSFNCYADVMPNNSILLVDTYHTEQGIKNAIITGQRLRKKGYDLMGIRLDSGDLEILSKKARQLLDEAGFKETKIVASGDLEENIIASLKNKNAPIDIWGVGTKLTTSYDQPSLDTAYKLSAIQNKQGQWQYKIKLSDSPEKTTNPGIQQIRRYFQQQKMVKDVIYDIHYGIDSGLPANIDYCVDLLTPIFSKGKLVYKQPSLNEIRENCIQQVEHFIDANYQLYPVKLEKKLQNKKADMIAKIKN